jgi:hypothetical protein
LFNYSRKSDWPHCRWKSDAAKQPIALEGVRTGRQVSVIRIDAATGDRLGLVATGIVGEGGWVDLADPIMVRAGDAFIVVPESALDLGDRRE